MRLEAATTLLLVGLIGNALGQIRWGQGHGGHGGGDTYNPGSEFPALGGGDEFPALGGSEHTTSHPGVNCLNKTTGQFGPCTGGYQSQCF